MGLVSVVYTFLKTRSRPHLIVPTLNRGLDHQSNLLSIVF